MSVDIRESDWKIFRDLHEVALNRFCERVMSSVQAVISDPGKTAHERYLAVYDLMKRRDKELARAFDDMRRSTALFQLACIQYQDLLTAEEISRFSPETQEKVRTLLEISRS